MRLQRNLTTLLIAMTICIVSLAQTKTPKPEGQPKIRYPNVSQGRSKTARGPSAADKLSTELRILSDQFGITRGGSEPSPLAFSDQELRNLFDIGPDNPNPAVTVAITVSSALDIKELRAKGAKFYLQQGNTIYADVPVLSLGSIAGERAVVRIGAMKAASVPPRPKEERPPLNRPSNVARGVSPVTTNAAPTNLDTQFAKGGLSGKGVIVGVIDTGIDWQHRDFRRPDGTSRILYLWDMYDDSYVNSQGKIGSPGPVLQEGADPARGTIYTNAQINAALSGNGTVNSMDNFGHGTAVAGTAAGNGRATSNGVPEGTYVGVAPEADLMIVKASNCGSFASIAHLGTKWIAETAKKLGRPVVINHSYGGHYSVHDGNSEEELAMNDLVGTGKPGVAITVSAGNEGQYSLHASGRFGPRRPGQADVEGTSIKLAVEANDAIPRPKMIGAFHSEDEWGLGIVGSGKFMTDENGKSQACFIYKIDGQIRVALGQGAKETDEFVSFADSVLNASVTSATGGGKDEIVIPLPPDNYWIWGLGISEKVRNGRFDLYLPYFRYSNFTYGADKRLMVGAPGNASNVITVAAYDFRSEWANQKGTLTAYNLALSGISDYSSPGGRRPDGVFKPDITAPATYTISSLSRGTSATPPVCQYGNMLSEAGNGSLTPDGEHIAWSGTSASAPFTAGVIALMLEKNPKLDAKQIREILIKTAIKGDRFVGAVPNPEWGYGKINPAAAIIRTPR